MPFEFNGYDDEYDSDDFDTDLTMHRVQWTFTLDGISIVADAVKDEDADETALIKRLLDAPKTRDLSTYCYDDSICADSTFHLTDTKLTIGSCGGFDVGGNKLTIERPDIVAAAWEDVEAFLPVVRARVLRRVDRKRAYRQEILDNPDKYPHMTFAEARDMERDADKWAALLTSGTE